MVSLKYSCTADFFYFYTLLKVVNGRDFSDDNNCIQLFEVHESLSWKFNTPGKRYLAELKPNPAAGVVDAVSLED